MSPRGNNQVCQRHVIDEMKPALFLDRDGIINIDHHYVHRIDDFTFIEGAFALACAAAKESWPVIVVTNQSGIGRGYYDESDFAALTAWMIDRFEAEGAPITAVYHCPYHPQAAILNYRQDHPWRKPRPGMLLAARDAHEIDLSRSILVGDSYSDIAAAEAAGLPIRILVGAGAGEAIPVAPTHRVATTLAASRLVTQLINQVGTASNRGASP